MEDEIIENAFLHDVDLEVKIRSGKSDLRNLTKLINAIKASLTSGIDPTILLTETYTSTRSTSDGSVSTVVYKFYKL